MTLTTALALLHDRGVINETAFEDVCGELLEDGTITRDQLCRIFGTAEIFHLMTIPDLTARQLLREALELFTNPETTIDRRDWLQSAEGILGPITFGRPTTDDHARGHQHDDTGTAAQARGE